MQPGARCIYMHIIRASILAQNNRNFILFAFSTYIQFGGNNTENHVVLYLSPLPQMHDNFSYTSF